jgi:hypothetical protein
MCELGLKEAEALPLAYEPMAALDASAWQMPRPHYIGQALLLWKQLVVACDPMLVNRSRRWVLRHYSLWLTA